ncbi:hypothetical protein RJ640_008220 [Escallonia rubra]|uniref:DUF3475 domain-containing protein n=1 Tax=Escallonia rubra TaxID=112253 RepID=A0AA88QDS8_9ASTE|nr:hypothetical protein RJ640_008220 [Escallonia rubra]
MLRASRTGLHWYIEAELVLQVLVLWAEVSSRLGRAGTLGLEKAAEVLDTLGSSMTNLNSGGGFVSGPTTKGNELSILAFEVANTIVKGYSLMQSLSKRSIRQLKEKVLPSEGVQLLVSKDTDELLRIVAADKREELKIFSVEVIRFGNRCKDPQWHNLDRYFEKHSRDPPKLLKEEADLVTQQLMTLVQYTADNLMSAPRSLVFQLSWKTFDLIKWNSPGWFLAGGKRQRGSQEVCLWKDAVSWFCKCLEEASRAHKRFQRKLWGKNRALSVNLVSNSEGRFLVGRVEDLRAPASSYTEMQSWFNRSGNWQVDEAKVGKPDMRWACLEVGAGFRKFFASSSSQVCAQSLITHSQSVSGGADALYALLLLPRGF